MSEPHASFNIEEKERLWECYHWGCMNFVYGYSFDAEIGCALHGNTLRKIPFVKLRMWIRRTLKRIGVKK